MNQLTKETSPYLLQHSNNPVEWYNWEDGLKKAKTEKKPLFISIGYSACHWCHVMEKESFNDPETAKLMNKLFINIKIDREERPDLDSYYQKAVTFLTKRPGGWPLTVFATPNGKAFAGGTYFPKKPSFGLPSFNQILNYVHSEYEKNPKQIKELTQQVLMILQKNFSDIRRKGSMEIQDILNNSLVGLLDSYDIIFGGFGFQPKFPQISELRYLILSFYRSQNKNYLDAVITSLDKMAEGGIYDQIGFGFHRYSVDRKWLIPHFEKMLYDNAQLITLYLEAYQITKKRDYADIAIEIIEYLNREMKDKDGGFYSSQDADSEGEEGKFFVWTLDEIEKVLGKDEGKEFSKYFGVTNEGNFEKGFSILHKTPDFLKAIKDKKAFKRISEQKKRLFEYRENRPKPFLNDNIISSWNSLLIYALAKASFILNNPNYLEIAEKALKFILNKMKEENTERLFRHFRIHANTYGFAEDYAFLINALIEVFSITGNKFYLEEAVELQNIFDKHFWDPIHHGYYFNGDWQNDISFREKHIDTFSIPSANAISLENLLRIYYYIGGDNYLNRAEELVEFLIGWYEEHGHLNGDSLIALDMYLNKPIEFIIFTEKKDIELNNSPLKYLKSTYVPQKVFLHIYSEVIEKLNSLQIIKEKIENQNLDELLSGTAFICKDFTCSTPLKNYDELESYLKGIL